MGKRTVQRVVVECDRCKTTENTGDMEGRDEWGETSLSWSGHTGGRCYDGSAGGCNHEGKGWLCLRCTRDFLAFMRGKAVEPLAKGAE